MSNLSVRPFLQSEQEYEALAQLYASLFSPEQINDFEASDGAEFQEADEDFDTTKYTFQRYVAEDQETGAIVGYAQFYHTPWAFNPQNYQGTIRVHRDRQNQGIGSQLYEQVRRELVQRDARELRTEIYTTYPNALAFAEHRGFQELFRSLIFQLDPQAYDLAALQPVTERLAAGGITITSLAQAKQDDPVWATKLYDLHVATKRDMPLDEVYTPPPFERFVESLNDDEVVQEAFMIARAGDSYVGECYTLEGDQPESLVLQFVGVRADYRRQGVATALILGSVAYAHQHDTSKVVVWTESVNPGMLALLEKLDFQLESSTVFLAARFA